MSRLDKLAREGKSFRCDAKNFVDLCAYADTLHSENAALRKEVNALRGKLGMGRKYVEWDQNKTTGGCPTSAVDRPCLWCGKMEDAHGPPGLSPMAPTPQDRLCPGTSSAFYTPARKKEK